MGHEMTGVVHSLGKKVKTDSLKKPLKEGDELFFHSFFPCISCYNCIRGEFGACKTDQEFPMRILNIAILAILSTLY